MPSHTQLPNLRAVELGGGGGGAPEVATTSADCYGPQGSREKRDPSKGPRQAAAHGHKGELPRVFCKAPGRNGCRWGKKGFEVKLSCLGVGTAAQDVIWAGEEEERRADPRGTPGALINPGAICPNLEVSGKTHQSLDKRTGREGGSRGQIHSPKGAFHRPHLYWQPEQPTFTVTVYPARGEKEAQGGKEPGSRSHYKLVAGSGFEVIRTHLRPWSFGKVRGWLRRSRRKSGASASG